MKLCPVCKEKYTGSTCNVCKASYMRNRRLDSKLKPIQKTCSKCSANFLSRKAHNICDVCKSVGDSNRWRVYSKTINRNTKESRDNQKEYNNGNRALNIGWLTNTICEGTLKCFDCNRSSSNFEYFDLHHEDSKLKTSSPTQLIRRRTFTKTFFREKLVLLCKRCHSLRHNYHSQYTRLEEFGIEPMCFISREKHDWLELEFHHIDGKDFEISNSFSNKMPIDAILKEIEKCVLIHYSHHRLIHSNKLCLLPVKCLI